MVDLGLPTFVDNFPVVVEHFLIISPAISSQCCQGFAMFGTIACCRDVLAFRNASSSFHISRASSLISTNLLIAALISRRAFPKPAIETMIPKASAPVAAMEASDEPHKIWTKDGMGIEYLRNSQLPQPSRKLSCGWRSTSAVHDILVQSQERHYQPSLSSLPPLSRLCQYI